VKAWSRGFLFLMAMIAASAAVRGADAVTALLDPYFRIQTALVQDRTDTIKADAALVAKEAAALGEAGKPIEQAATLLARARDLAQSREAFGTLSDAVITYAEQTKAKPGADVTAMYCPMVKKSWLQKGQQVKNPYFGKSMPGCGERKKLS
jgi:Protein of unknown function (DUF3347)